jgi:hypothetical protein
MHLEPRPERRKRRSDDPLSALNLQLDFTRHEAELDALVLADQAGYLVAGAGASSTCEMLAAHAPLFANGHAPPREGELFGDPNEIKVQSVWACGSELLLCAKGRGWQRALSLARAAAGCRRILDSK